MINCLLIDFDICIILFINKQSDRRKMLTIMPINTIMSAVEEEVTVCDIQ
jgi:hypothetical protein